MAEQSEPEATTERITVGLEVRSGNPFYRVEVVQEGDTLKLEVETGDGITNSQQIAFFSLTLAGQLTGVPWGELVGVVDAYRRAAGLPPLADAAFRKGDQ